MCYNIDSGGKKHMTHKQFRKEANELFTQVYQSSIEHESPDVISSRQLHRKFKALLKTLFPDCTIHHTGGGYCEDSGFVEKDGHFVYISISDLRFWKNWDQDVLIRTAGSKTDYRGGRNNRTTLDKLQEDVYKLLTQTHTSW